MRRKLADIYQIDTLDIGFRRDPVGGGDRTHARLSQSAHRAFYRTGL